MSDSDTPGPPVPRRARRGVARAVAVLACLLVTVSLSLPVAAQRQPSTPGWDRYVQPLIDAGLNGAVGFPAEYRGGRLSAVGNPAGYTFHMTPADDPREELVHRAGEVFDPPSGGWRLWLQGDGWMSAQSRLVIWASGAPRGLVPVMLTLQPAGWVLVPEEHLDTAGSDLWVLYTGTDDGEHEMSRRRPRSAVADGLQMPAGRNIAGLWSGEEDRFIALSRPFWVDAGGSVAAPLERPAEDASWMLVYARRPSDGPSRPHGDVELAAVRGSERVPSDETVQTAWGPYAVWYGLPPGPIRIAGGGRELYLEPAEVELEAGAIHRFDERLAPRPSLTVSLVLPTRVRQALFSLEVHRLGEAEPLEVEELGRLDGSHRFTRLVGGPVEVRLVTALGTVRQEVELVPGEDHALAFEPELIEVDGTVRLAGAPSAAALVFRTAGGTPLPVEAGDDGTYRAFTIEPLTSVEAEVVGSARPAWIKAFAHPVDDDRQLDLDLP